VYLGELGDGQSRHAQHLRSRHEVGHLLAGGATPVTEVRSAMISGSGSLSFEMLRYLTEVLPVPRTRWTQQPVPAGGGETTCSTCSSPPGGLHLRRPGGRAGRARRGHLSPDDGVCAQEAGLRRRVVIPCR
jgi:hypothetical protein